MLERVIKNINNNNNSNNNNNNNNNRLYIFRPTKKFSLM